MRETFNLYGMNVTVDGDTNEARSRLGLARKLMFQTKLQNTNNLDIISGGMRLSDGTVVRVLSQHGQDSAYVYFPEKPQKGGKGQHEEFAYYPAFEAYDANDVHIGYVISRSKSFSGPYEFIPKSDGWPVDIFEYGQWLENYESRPFDDIKQFLIPKQIWDEPQREIFEIPPAGTTNRMFLGMTEPVEANERFQGGGVCWECCISADGFLLIYMLNVMADFSIYKEDSHERRFTYTPDGETGYIPPDMPGQTSPALLEMAYNWGVEYHTERLEASGTMSYQWVTAPFMDASAIDPYPATCEGAKQKHLSLGGDTCADALAGYTPQDIYNFNTDYLFAEVDGDETPMPSQDNTAGATRANYIGYDAEEVWHRTAWHSYQTKHSSVEDSSHYGVAFENLTRDYERSTSRNHSNCPVPEGLYYPFGNFEGEDVLTIEAVLSGSSFIFKDYSIDDRLLMDDYIVRYYRIGGFEVMLGIIAKETGTGSYEYRFFYIDKSGQNTTFDDSCVLFGDEEKAIIPGVTDTNGNPVYAHRKFRLVREDRVIFE